MRTLRARGRAVAGPGGPVFRVRPTPPPGPPPPGGATALAVLLLNVLPMAEEGLRCWRAVRAHQRPDAK